MPTKKFPCRCGCGEMLRAEAKWFPFWTRNCTAKFAIALCEGETYCEKCASWGYECRHASLEHNERLKGEEPSHE